jgi:hypothetical protein
VGLRQLRGELGRVAVGAKRAGGDQSEHRVATTDPSVGISNLSIPRTDSLLGETNLSVRLTD